MDLHYHKVKLQYSSPFKTDGDNGHLAYYYEIVLLATLFHCHTGRLEHYLLAASESRDPQGRQKLNMFNFSSYCFFTHRRALVAAIFMSHYLLAATQLDYTVLHQVLLENDIKLHILMNEVFRVDKDRVNKMFYGIDSINAYTKKDFKNLKGSTELRRQVRLPKAHLGFCIPLAMESNGTIFSAKKLELTRKNAVKKFVTVFTRRVAMTAVPCQCQKCECTADNDGMSYMECFPCQYPTPGFYNENDVGDGDNYDDLVMEVVEDDEYLNE
uniref:Uncharacterized protein n=1 Tax=Timema tahoe TaxID=61484 RepID=A0A7R9INV5_9NEOP|nr:unnamed protein product [Timema tahoe]